MMKYRLNRRAALGLLGGTAAASLVAVPGARVSAQTLDKVSYQTNWRAQAEHGGFYLAVANGTYETMAGAGVLTQGLDPRKSYSLEFVNKGIGA
jgi:hypothetical protein